MRDDFTLILLARDLLHSVKEFEQEKVYNVMRILETQIIEPHLKKMTMYEQDKLIKGKITYEQLLKFSEKESIFTPLYAAIYPKPGDPIVRPGKDILNDAIPPICCGKAMSFELKNNPKIWVCGTCRTQTNIYCICDNSCDKIGTRNKLGFFKTYCCSCYNAEQDMNFTKEHWCETCKVRSETG